MDKHFGYTVMRNFDYSQPFAEGIVNGGRKDHNSSHILSKKCLDIFLPCSSAGPASTSDSSVNLKRELNNAEETPQQTMKAGHENTVTSQFMSSGLEDAVDEMKLGPSSEIKTHLIRGQDDVIRNGDVGKREKNKMFQKQGSKIPPPPLVVFAYGGGWRRGDKQAWRHFLSRWDINLGLTAIVGRDRLYDNVGESFASRGFPCAVLSYPLVPTPFPINLIEMGSSFLISLAFTFLLTLLSSLILDVFLMTLSFQPLIPRLWNFLQTHSSFSVQWAMLAIIIIISQLLTLAIIVSRELFLKSRNQLETKKISWTDLIFVLTIMTSLLLYFYYLAYSKGFDNVTFSICGFIVLFVQFLVHEFQQMTTFNDRFKMKSLVADPRGQAESVALSLKWLVDYGRSTGNFDPDSIILMGHSAGGHLVSLVTLDHRYLADIGVSPRIIKGVITLSAVHDLKSISKGFLYHFYLKPAFGVDPNYWTRMSPIQYVKQSETENSNCDSRLPAFSSSSSSSFSPTSTSPLQGRTPRTLHLRRSASSPSLLSANSASSSLPTDVLRSSSSPTPSSQSPHLQPPPSPPLSSSSSLSLPLSSSSSSPSSPSSSPPPPETTLPFLLPSSSSSQSLPHRPHFLIISAAKDFDFMIEDSDKMHSHLRINGYVTKRTIIQGCNHFTMIKQFGCPWYWYWPGATLGRRANWKPSDGELMCWEFVQQFWSKE